MKFKISFAIVIFINTLLPGATSDTIELITNTLSKPSASITWENERADIFSVYFYKKSSIQKTIQSNEERRNFTKSKALIVLDFSTEYTFVTTCTQNGSESERGHTVVLKTPATPKPIALSKNTALVLLLYFPDAKFIQLIVQRLPQPSEIPETTKVNTTELLPEYNTDIKSRYIAITVDHLVKDEIFIVGNDSVYTYNNVVYHNVPLEPNTKYMFFQRTYLNNTVHFSHEWMEVQTKPEEATNTLSGTKIGLISAGTVLGALLLVIGFCCILCYQHSNKSVKENNEIIERRATVTSDHIPNMKFSSLVSAIDRTPNVSIVKTNSNAKKISSFQPHVEYDVRAKINDYYKNATFIPGFLMERDYIVLESLLEDEVDLLWKVVWENNVNQIVMIGCFEEKKKCLCKQYFPSEDVPMVFNMYNVSVIKVQSYANMISRTISLECGGVKRIVYHYQFLSWKSDQGKPSHPSLFIQFVLSIIKEEIQNIAPIIVHSTSRKDFANVYTCVDAQMRSIVERNDVNVHSNVLKIRNQIKSLEEFIFVHDCVLEFIRVKSFEDISIENLSKYLDSIKKENSKEINSEFNFILKNLSNNQKSLVADIKDPDSCFKPFDYNRVKINNSDNTDYINASYIDTFLKKKAYVVIETPKPQKIESFWQMVIKKKLWVVILFSEKEDEELECFLTDTLCNNFSLKLISEKSNIEKCFKAWCLLLTLKSDTEASEEAGEGKLITFYQYLKWPKSENLSLENISHFLNFVQESEEEKVKLDAKRILLVSSFEGGQLGTYIALKSIAEEIESSGNVNIFRTIYTLRQQRQGIIQTEADYALIYACALELTKRLQRTGEVIEDRNTLSVRNEQNVIDTQSTFLSSNSLKNFIGHTNSGFNNEEVVCSS